MAKATKPVPNTAVEVEYCPKKQPGEERAAPGEHLPEAIQQAAQHGCHVLQHVLQEPPPGLYGGAVGGSPPGRRGGAGGGVEGGGATKEHWGQGDPGHSPHGTVGQNRTPSRKNSFGAKGKNITLAPQEMGRGGGEGSGRLPHPPTMAGKCPSVPKAPKGNFGPQSAPQQLRGGPTGGQVRPGMVGPAPPTRVGWGEVTPPPAATHKASGFPYHPGEEGY